MATKHGHQKRIAHRPVELGRLNFYIRCGAANVEMGHLRTKGVNRQSYSSRSASESANETDEGRE